MKQESKHSERESIRELEKNREDIKKSVKPFLFEVHGRASSKPIVILSQGGELVSSTSSGVVSKFEVWGYPIMLWGAGTLWACPAGPCPPSYENPANCCCTVSDRLWSSTTLSNGTSDVNTWSKLLVSIALAYSNKPKKQKKRGPVRRKHIEGENRDRKTDHTRSERRLDLLLH